MEIKTEHEADLARIRVLTNGLQVLKRGLTKEVDPGYDEQMRIADVANGAAMVTSVLLSNLPDIGVLALQTAVQREVDRRSINQTDLFKEAAKQLVKMVTSMGVNPSEIHNCKDCERVQKCQLAPAVSYRESQRTAN